MSEDAKTDRELLELAARAAGYEGAPWYKDSLLVPHATENRRVSWNPLTDDGDALRLAVKLRINIYNPPGKNASASIYFADTDFVSYFNEQDDDAAAIRRAIVRCAAALASAEPAPNPADTDRAVNARCELREVTR